MIQEEETFCCKPCQIICPAVWEIAGCRTIVEIEAFTELLLQPLLCGAQTPLLFDGHKDLVQCEKLILTLSFFCHKASDIFMVCICIGINRGIRQCILVYEIVNKLGEVQLARMNTIDIFKILAIFLFKVFQAALKVLR